jgi:biopolymer transport protein ExbD
MGVSMGNTGKGSVADINMTPMIDVLLVLLVIFIIAQPMLQKTIDTQVPKKEKAQQNNAPLIVLEIHSNGQMAVNTQDTGGKAGLEAKLRQIFANRDEQALLFVKPDPDVVLSDVIFAMDRARGAGVKVIGTVLSPDQ